MSGFAKLSSDLITSSLWSEDNNTRILFITMLAMADKNGNVNASIPGLAKVAVLTIEDTEKSLNKLLSPDPYSRSKECNGSRLTMADGGFHIVTYQKRRLERDPNARREQNRVAQEAYRKRYNQLNNEDSKPKVSHSKPRSAHTEAEAEAEADKNKYIAPKLTEVVEHFINKGSTEVEANSFFEYFSSAGWHDSKGRKVMYWKRNAATWLSNNKPKVKTKAELLAEAEATPRKNRTWDQTLMLMKAAGSKELAEHPERYEVEL